MTEDPRQQPREGVKVSILNQSCETRGGSMIMMCLIYESRPRNTETRNGAVIRCIFVYYMMVRLFMEKIKQILIRK